VAVERGTRILETAATNYPRHRSCFACHHQTLPLLGWRAARDAGCSVNESLGSQQIEFSRKSFSDKLERMRAGQSIGGRAATASYALWTWSIAEATRDDTTAALVEYLLHAQHADGSWKPPSNRPPLEESTISCTVLSAAGLLRWSPGERQEATRAAVEKARRWLADAPRRTHEDVVFALWSTALLKTQAPSPAELLVELQDSQQADGGWGAAAGLNSDAYATGQTLYVLLQTPWPVTSDVRDRAVEWLLREQKADGSWHVVTRSKPIQEWFDNGDPHGDDQFISIAATGWAVASLAARLHAVAPAAQP
jgi:N-acyl-D-amino-acid deacylase